ncbi:glycoside hydrolase family 38 N-terminal domain-containing protein [Kribbella sp. NPDC004138]
MPTRSVAIIPTSHLDLFWLGDYRNCLRRGDEVIRSYLDRAIESGDETFVIDTAIFAEHFLAENPAYEGKVRKLLAEGRLEIGAAYIDRWENLVLGESIIRNIQIGRAWARERLGVDAQLAAHPDLPGLNAQTGQIYAQAGIRYYVTSRKIFHEGRIWRHRGPDGSAMTMVTWPQHYVFLALNESGLDPRTHGSFLEGRTLSFDDLESRYPHGVVAVSGSAGDLTAAGDFTTRYGKDLREYVGQYRAEEPDLTISYAIPATVVAPYLATDTPLLEVSGSLPSVWGVAPDEEMRFFHRVRRLEALLLDGETASAIGVAAGRTPLPESAKKWRGLYGEDAFFDQDDYAPDGREWEWLWRMHVFTQDHNGGGMDGQLSIFQKKVRHDRALGFASEVLDHAVGRGESDQPALVRTRLGDSDRHLMLDESLSEHLAKWLARCPEDSVQFLEGPGDTCQAVLRTAAGAGVGCGPIDPAPITRAPEVHETEAVITIHTDHVDVSIDRATGRLDLRDAVTGALWTVPVGGAYAVPEHGNDVTLATDETAATPAVLESVELTDRGPVVARVIIRWQLLDVVFTSAVRVWAGEPRVDLETTVDWPGFENWQIRLPLATADRSTVSHGTPFHGSGWDEVDARMRPLMPDEISPENLRAYREVQHWLHVDAPEGGLAILTEHPAFRHAGERLEAVLLRTAPSCGDPRMAWANPGRTAWTLRLVPTGAGIARAEVAEMADVAWRAPRIVPDASPQVVELLRNEGDDVRLSALFLDQYGANARLVNQSDAPATVRLTGAAVGASADLVDLDDNVVETVESIDGEVRLTLPPWRIQTLRLGQIRQGEQS